MELLVANARVDENKKNESIFPAIFSYFVSKSPSLENAIELETSCINNQDRSDFGRIVSFECDTWELRRKNGSFNFLLYTDASKRRLNQVLALNKKGAQLHFCKSRTVQNIFYPLDQLLFQWEFIRKEAFMVHGCAFAIDGRGYLALGESGSGKTTLVRTLQQADPNAMILNDERNVIFYDDKGLLNVAATPWHGELETVNNHTLPLQAIFFIERSGANLVKRLSTLDALERAIRTCFLPFWAPELMEPYLSALEKTLCIESRKLFSLSFDPTSDIKQFITEALNA